MLIDTHAHLYWDSFKEDFDEVIERSIQAGVTTIINVGVDVEKSREAVQVSKKLTLSGVEGFSTIGIHPHEALKYTSGVSLQKDIEKLEQIYKSSPTKVVAVGECGLDFSSTSAVRRQRLGRRREVFMQRQLFQAQIDLAKKLNLPLIVHCRDNRSKDLQNSQAWDEVIKMTKNHFGIYHCYSGLPQTTNYLLQTTNFLVSFAGTITYPKNDYLREAATLLPLEKIVLETDCPFLPPQSKRGQRNEPANIKEIAQIIANLKRIPEDVVAEQTTKNAKKIFKI